MGYPPSAPKPRLRHEQEQEQSKQLVNSSAANLESRHRNDPEARRLRSQRTTQSSRTDSTPTPSMHSPPDLRLNTAQAPPRKPSVRVRESVSFPPSPHAYEPTSSLALTSPAGSFVDLRLRRAVHAHEAAEPNTGATARLERGCAGSVSEVEGEVEDEVEDDVGVEARGLVCADAVRVRRRTWVDSAMPRLAAAARTETVLHSCVLGGGQDRMVAYFTALEPRLGRAVECKEVWRYVGLEARGVGVVLRCGDEDDDEQDAEADTGEKARGLVVRVGSFCQGIVQCGKQCATERWERDGEGVWKRVARTGDAFLPCSVALRPQIVCVGARVRYAGSEWVVEEAWEWSE